MNICCDLPALCRHVVEVLVMWEESRVSHSLGHLSHVTDHMTFFSQIATILSIMTLSITAVDVSCVAHLEVD